MIASKHVMRIMSRRALSTAPPRRVVFLGPPGSGKGSYSKIVAPRLGVPHLSTGDMLRAEVERGSALGKRVEAVLRAGGMVNDELVMSVLRAAQSTGGGEGSTVGYVLDGFPRTVSQAEALDAAASSGGVGGSSRLGLTPSSSSAAVERVIHIVMDESILVPKLLGRRRCVDCGASVNVADVDAVLKVGGDDVRVRMPPVRPDDDACPRREGGGEHRLRRRDDDTEEVIRARLAQYRERTEPVVDFYRRRGIVRDIVVVGGYDVMTPIFESALDIQGN